jgi:hypothetical protein
VVAVDPSAPYAAAVRRALPQARIAVDHFHLVLLANQALTRVRQRVTRELLDRRGRAIDPVWANRRLLLRGRERLCARALARMWNGCVHNDPTGQIVSAWIAKEELRRLLGAAARGGHRHEINARLYDFYTWCADAEIPERSRRAHQGGVAHDARGERAGTMARYRARHPASSVRNHRFWRARCGT